MVLGGKREKIVQVVDDDVGPGIEQHLGSDATVHAEHQAEGTRPARLGTGMRVFDNDALCK